MASGYTSAVTNGSFSIRFYWSSSYNASTNKSTITVIPQVYNTGNYGGDLRACGYNLSGAGIYLNGTRSYAFDATWGTANNLRCSANVNSWTNFPPYSGSIGTMTVTHNANGVATATVRFLGTVVPLNYESYRKGIDTGNQTITITENAASTVASCSSSVETQGTFSLTMTRKASTNYHIATFKYNNVTTLYTSDRFDTSLSFAVPRSWFTNYPSITSLPITVSIQTYNSGGTAVGSAVTRSLTVTADADMKPSVSAGWASLAPYNTGAVSGITGYVKGYSQAEATFDSTKIDMTDAVGASIASYSIMCQGETDSAAPYLTPLLASTSVSVVCTVTDSRGRTASESFTLTVMDYADPSTTGQEVFRCNSLGEADEDGTYLSVKATAIFSSLNSQNVCTLTAAYKASGGSYGTATTLTSGTASLLSPVSADTSYTVKITATDTLGNSAVYYATVPTRKWAMKFRSNGRGVAFGKAAETNDLFEVTPDWDVQIGGDLTVLGSIIGGGGGGSGIAIQDTEPTNGELVWIDTDEPGISHEVVETGDIAFVDFPVTWTTYNCSGTITSDTPKLKISGDGKMLWCSGGRPTITSFSRSGANPGIQAASTSLRPSSQITLYGGIRIDNATVKPETIWITIETSGEIFIRTTEALSNASGTPLRLFVPPCMIPIT